MQSASNAAREAPLEPLTDDAVAPPLRSRSGLAQTCADLLSLVHGELPFDLWMVTRVDGDDWLVLQSQDRHYGVEPGRVFRWRDSFCSRMVRGEGPVYAAVSDDVPAYRDAPIARQVPIGSYFGTPIRLPDGSLFGTLCAISPTARLAERLTDAQSRVADVVASTLGTLADLQLRHDSLARRTPVGRSRLETDAITGTANLVGFMAAMRDEEARSRAIGEDACVLSIGVEGLDAIRETEGTAGVGRQLCVVAEELAAATRDHDRIARTEDDGFGVLLSECRSSRIDGLIERFYQGFAQRRLPVTIGGCGFRQAGSLARAWRVARDVRRAELPGRA